MGCGSGQKEVAQPLRRTTVTGVLKITVVDAHIEHLTSTFFKMDPFVKLKFSNREFQSKTAKDGGT